MTDDQHGEGTPQGGGRWNPLPHGDYDDGATAFVKLPEGGIDALLSGDSPLAAPGHGYVPPQITVAPGTGDPAATGTWAAPAGGAEWPDPNATPQVPTADDRFTYQPGATQHWTFDEPAAPAAPGHDVTGQWSIPVAGGDLPDESGEFTTSSLVEQWGGTPPATLPGGAPAPWATQDTGRPWGRPADTGHTALPDHTDAHPAGAPAAPAPGYAPAPDERYRQAPADHATAPHEETGAGETAHGDAGHAPAGHEDTGHQPAAHRDAGHPPVGHGDAGHAPASHEDTGHPPAARGDGRRAEGAEAQADAQADARGVEAGRPGAFGESAEPVRPAQSGEFREFGESAEPEQPGVPTAFPEQRADSAAGPGPGPGTDGHGPAEPAERPADGPTGHEGPEAPAGVPQAATAPTTPAGPATADAAAADHSAPRTPASAAVPENAADAPGTAVAAEPGADDAPEGAAEEHAEHAAPLPPNDDHPLASYVLRVNGADRPVTDAWIGESLLYVLRERLGLAGAKDGCSQGECGACNVQVDGRLVASCLVPAVTAAGSEVRTVEGLAVDGQPSDVQRALARCGAVQCGFCVPGMAMTLHDLLEGNPAPTELETRQALCGNLCRCSGYRGVLQAVQEVVAEREASHAADAETDAGEARIPHQAGPGAGGVNPSAFEAPGAFDTPRAAPGGYGDAPDPYGPPDPYGTPPHGTPGPHDQHGPHDPHYGQDGGQA
ncbi:2Fe-2S iron-sulfur cluster-binding protein [Streptomyces sp. NPDC007205]|uniref:2Fe-2S iron-sulfur cluster-binding protein n=1 Tax=Streptomyces sp. NPDC007205 TaxID=3154316 RepID=UPI00340504F1